MWLEYVSLRCITRLWKVGVWSMVPYQADQTPKNQDDMPKRMYFGTKQKSMLVKGFFRLHVETKLCPWQPRRHISPKKGVPPDSYRWLQSMLVHWVFCLHCHVSFQGGYTYCWWKKSCTTWYGWYTIIYGVLYIPGGAGFLPSTVYIYIQYTYIVTFAFLYLFIFSRSYRLPTSRSLLNRRRSRKNGTAF